MNILNTRISCWLTIALLTAIAFKNYDWRGYLILLFGMVVLNEAAYMVISTFLKFIRNLRKK